MYLAYLANLSIAKIQRNWCIVTYVFSIPSKHRCNGLLGKLCIVTYVFSIPSKPDFIEQAQEIV